MRSLRIYGWQDFRNVSATQRLQTREIVAAYSRADAARKTKRLPHQLFNLGETWSNAERAIAMQQPGVIYWCNINDSHRSDCKWTPAT